MDDECDLWLLSSRFSDDLVATARELGASTAALEAPLVDKATVDSVAGADLKTRRYVRGGYYFQIRGQQHSCLDFRY